MAAILMAKFVGDVEELTAAYDRAHALIMERGGAVPFGELRHHCATSDDIGVWEPAEHIRQRWASDEMRTLLEGTGFPTEPTERDDPGPPPDRAAALGHKRAISGH